MTEKDYMKYTDTCSKSLKSQIHLLNEEYTRKVDTAKKEMNRKMVETDNMILDTMSKKVSDGIIITNFHDWQFATKLLLDIHKRHE